MSASQFKEPSVAPVLTVRVARELDDLIKCQVLRSLAFIGEQGSPYDEEFDGNDLCATHVLAMLNNEPVGALRIRYFAGFAKPERLAVHPAYRLKRIDRTTVPRVLVDFAVDHCRRKGYTTLYGHAQRRLVSFWGKFGFKPCGEHELHYSDHEYVVLRADYEPHPEAITVESPPLVIVRPEGDWQKPGPFDLSLDRPPTNRIAAPTAIASPVSRGSSFPAGAFHAPAE
ncbi:GNAT family N-acetyltransferase [Azospirillum sp. SYSU D00513]|uniref:GNAT family N-acetyltransferase n=1 Tax=Azospirillum sp. SYSU D00513 TaxID=2812561 RepID=UPI001A957472|nr:GNAT family N-acetyltransferase [Azospirillum sp. SYSU D00513]